MKKLKLILRSKYLFKILCIICIFYSIFVALYLPIRSKYKIDDTQVVGKILQYQIDGNKLKVILKGKEKIVIYYYFQTLIEKSEYQEKLELGAVLKLVGKLMIPKKNTVPNGFNYRDYLQYHHINYYMLATRLDIIENNTSVFYYLKNNLIKRMDKIDTTGYFRTFILGDKTLLDDDTIKNYQQNGVSHLFSISGMHISFIVGFVMFILKKISYNNFYQYSLLALILLFYLFLTDFGASVLRTVIMFIVFAINKTFNLKIKKFDLMLIVLIVAILLNPFILFDTGFQFSYCISFTLIVFHKKIASLKSGWSQKIYTSFICFLVSFPICVYNFSEVNILSIFLNLLMIPLVSVIIFPMTLLTFIVPIIYPIYKILIFYLEKLNILISTIKIFELILSKPSLILIIVYYVLIYLSFWKIHYLVLFMVILFLHKNYLFFDESFLLIMLDVGQGDSSFIKLPNNQGNILIDTGGEMKIINEQWKESKKEFSIVENSTIPYLKSLGINRLDYLIVTHGDYDHMGEAINLVENFKVDKVIFNCGEYNDLEKDLIDVLEKKKIKYYSCIKELNLNKYKLQFLNTKIYDNENDNSNVIYLKFNNYKFLFMGDAGIEKEKDILDKFDLEDIAFLKVGHHGSDTSSSEEFIENINPKFSLISVGKNNRYGHPKDEVLETLKNSKIYRTDLDGSIEIKLNKNVYKIRTCSP